jgi:type IV pilus assembly protein PilV
MRGVGLIEVLVSVLILGVGLLGIAAMQSLALRGGQGSLESSQAVMQATSIIEAMRANRANVASYVYDGLGACGTLPAGGTLAQNDIRSWVSSLKATIGSGVDDATTCGRIRALGGDRYDVTVQWNDERAGGGATRQITTETRI